LYLPEIDSVETSSAFAPPTVQPPTSSISFPITGRVLRFSAQELGAIKSHATEGVSWVSTFEALSAHLFQCLYRARLRLMRDTRSEQGKVLSDIMPEPLSNFLTPVNMRPADRLGLPPRYFHNAVETHFFTLPPSILMNSPLSQIAKAIHDCLQETHPLETDKTLCWIAAQPDVGRIKHRFVYGAGSVMISQWCKMDIYSATAFEEVPILVAPPFTPISLVDGLAYFVDTEEQVWHSSSKTTGPIDVYLALIEPLWAVLDHDPTFRRFR